MQEPRDGDFVAYIEALQRESAARLGQHQSVVDTSAAAKGSPADNLQAANADSDRAMQTIGRVLGRDRDAARVKAVVAAVAGGVFLLNWLGNGGAFSFILAVVLLAYAVPRLLAAFRGPGVTASNKAMVDHVFGRSMPGTTGTKK